MNISLLGFVLGLLLLAIPLYVIYALDLGIMRRLIRSFLLMAVPVALIGLLLQLLIRWNNIALNILVGVLICLLSSFVIIGKARLKSSKMLFPMFAGVLLSVFLISLYFLFFVIGLKNPFDARFFFPILGLLAGCSIGINVKALHFYYIGLVHHNRLYYYLLGNGGSHKEAVTYLLRRSFQAAALPILRRMSLVMVGVAPVMLYALVMSGVGVMTAVAIQILLYVAVLAMSFSSVFICIYVARRYSFDEYEKLKDVTKNRTTNPVAEES